MDGVYVWCWVFEFVGFDDVLIYVLWEVLLLVFEVVGIWFGVDYLVLFVEYVAVCVCVFDVLVVLLKCC